jgi:hypothetical protein
MAEQIFKGTVQPHQTRNSRNSLTFSPHSFIGSKNVSDLNISNIEAATATQPPHYHCIRPGRSSSLYSQTLHHCNQISDGNHIIHSAFRPRPGTSCLVHDPLGYFKP